MIASPATMKFRNKTSQQKRGCSLNYIISYVPELLQVALLFLLIFFIAGHG